MYYFFLFCILCLIFLNIINYFYPKDESNFFGFNIYSVSTESMQPDIYPNDLVIVKKVKDCSYLQKDDDIIFHLDKTFKFDTLVALVVHRILINNKDEKWITTKGINNRDSFPWEKKIKYEDVVAKVIYTIHLHKLFSFFKYFKEIFILLFPIIIIFFALFLIIIIFLYN
ncbi:Signal peptidase I [Candidatus Phytoplasma pini]|uniref:Signal peptidase I n=1 Tax=Candidatus Phytoplasma pini TaxID=267362 RepID=A0A559KJX2_9MOLU|nr:Signal peptidase I [Candidatus Phytoplasma pini]